MDITVKPTLLDHQISHVDNIYNSILNYNRALDASDTGTGKTYTSIYICILLKLKPFVICPKSVVPSWQKILKEFGFEPSGYELTTYENIYKHKLIESKKIRKHKLNLYPDDPKWSDNIEIFDFVFIFDEAHKCKNPQTLSGKLLLDLSLIVDAKILMLSATAVDKIGSFYVFGNVLNLYESPEEFTNWLSRLPNKHNPLLAVHQIIFPTYASRMSIDDTVNIFKENDIRMEPISMENYFDIEESYRELNKLNNPDELTNNINEEFDDPNESINNPIKLKFKSKSKSNFARTIKLRQHIEYLKIPTFVEQTLSYIGEGMSVVIFVNFTKTLLDLSTKLDTNCLIYGKQTIEERSKNIEDFSTDKSRIIICNIQSGGTGISLHDTLGIHPRISLISPTWSAQDLLQVLGRIHRAMAKTNCIQKIIFCKGTFDEHVGSILKTKINNIQMLNNGEISNQLNQPNSYQPNSNQPNPNQLNSNQPNLNQPKSKSVKSSQLAIANIIKNSYVKKEADEKAKLDEIEDIGIIYNELANLYNKRNQINQILSQYSNKLTDVKKREFKYKLFKCEELITVFELKLKKS